MFLTCAGVFTYVGRHGVHHCPRASSSYRVTVICKVAKSRSTFTPYLVGQESGGNTYVKTIGPVCYLILQVCLIDDLRTGSSTCRRHV